ncbi:hypothetical protein AGMMS49992_11910 [Clostridia bacterium]|nr:hypothetical protein AGMMS49992_11910 [Clostridia bacterium]
MEVKYNVSGDERKRLISTIGEILGVKPIYRGMPVMAHQVSSFTIDADGIVSWEDHVNAKVVARVIDGLAHKGFIEQGSRDVDHDAASLEPSAESIPDIPEQPVQAVAETMTTAEDTQCGYDASASDVLETIAIEIPYEGDPAILRALLQSKATLIYAALGETAYWYSPLPEYSPDHPGGWYGPAPSENILPIEFTADSVKLDWFALGADSETIQAWSAFLAAAVKFAKAAKRVTAKDNDAENQKFAFRVFLTRLGLVGAEYKTTRRILLQNLTGCSAWKGGPPREATA